MKTFTPRWSAKNLKTRTKRADETDKMDSVGSGGSLGGLFQKIVATETVYAAQRLLRECKFPSEPAPCAFHCGRPDECCRRCGASLAEHC